MDEGVNAGVNAGVDAGMNAGVVGEGMSAGMPVSDSCRERGHGGILSAYGCFALPSRLGGGRGRGGRRSRQQGLRNRAL